MFHSLLIVAYRIHCYIYIYIHIYIYLPKRPLLHIFCPTVWCARSNHLEMFVCFSMSVPVRQDRSKSGMMRRRRKREKKQPDGIAILKYRCFLFVGVSFVHWQRGAQFLLSQIRFTTYVEMRRIHCEPPISVSCTLLTTDRWKSFPRKVKCLWPTRIWRIPSFMFFRWFSRKN